MLRHSRGIVVFIFAGAKRIHSDGIARVLPERGDLLWGFVSQHTLVFFMAEEKVTASQTTIEEIFLKVMESYSVSNAEDADVRMTTAQIHAKVFAFYPSECFTPDLIYGLMKKAGFTFEVTGSEMDFYWLLKEK